jgi:hypothetical protein
MLTEVCPGWPEWTALVFYAALVAFAIPYHEPWADEAQSWQLARTLSLRSLFVTHIRYEGTPGLWHFLLWVLIRLHVSYTGLHWVCGAIATGAVALLLFKSPFPRYLKLLLPFTYFLLFQYAVVARPYVLVPILLFLIALCWKRHPLVAAVLLGLLANVSLHASVISGGLAIVYAIDRSRSKNPGARIARPELFTGAAIILCFYAFAIWTAWQPPDHALATSSGPLPLDLLWRFLLLCQGSIVPVLFWIAIIACFRARHALLFLLPVLLCALFCVFVYDTWWHVGPFFPLAIALLWITWPTQPGIPSQSEYFARIALVVMAGVQITWSIYAIQFDHYNAYSPDLAASEFLRPFVQRGATIAVTYSDDPVRHAYRSVGILPYFDHNIYINQPDPFWWWSTQNEVDELFWKVLPSHPTLILVELRTFQPDSPIDFTHPRIRLINQEGYSLTNVFCGERPAALSIEEKSCHLFFQRSTDLESHRQILSRVTGHPH